ncbi:MAG: PKD domain-containing protein, partial [Candidatus Bathyarchaeia archaeon]|nr:PKD domain-containing protein [Candidatus Bathyarchaeia archaeon]
WKTQYYLTVQTDPTGLSPAPTPPSGWYDEGTAVLTAPDTSYLNSDEYSFEYWDVDGTSQGMGVNPITVTMNQPHTATAHYTLVTPPPPPLSVSISPTTAKIKIGESVTFTSTVSGGVPDYSYQWYLNGSGVSGAIYPEWTFEPTSTGFYIVHLNVTDNLGSTVKSNEATVTVMPQLAVSISPMSASILVGQSVEFTSTVTGGYTPYSYQWYLNGNPVSGANSPSWTFTPTSEGIYYVYLKVTDANNNVAQSDTARITVGAVPVGGYSVSLTKSVAKTPLICYTTILALFGAAISLIKRKRK